MRALVQRVTRARVTVAATDGPGAEAETVGAIGPGLLVFVGVTHSDGIEQARTLATKLWTLRIFADELGGMNRSLAASGGEVLVVSQFTLYGETRKGLRPSWAAAARPDQARPVVDALVTTFRELGARVATGRFGADMNVELVNDGPVTLMVEV
ncbi:MAG: dtd [Actinomycetia bacterium]|nr:dtd [Actinomycetes bacterium]